MSKMTNRKDKTMDEKKNEKDKTRTQISIGLPKRIIDRIKAEAKNNHRSFSGECAMRLEESIARDNAAAGAICLRSVRRRSVLRRNVRRLRNGNSRRANWNCKG